MTPLHQNCINDLVVLQADLVKHARAEEYGKFMQDLANIERCLVYVRSQLQRRTVLDLTDTDDDEI